MTDNATFPVSVGLAVGIAFVTLFAFAFQSITPIPIIHIKPPPPLPEIRMIYNGSGYAAQAETFGWGGDMLYTGNVSNILSYQNATLDIKQNTTTIAFAIIINNNATELPVKGVYVYEYPSNDFDGELLRLDNSDSSGSVNDHSDRNNTFLINLEKGDYYLRANYQSDVGSVSYYFRISVVTDNV